MARYIIKKPIEILRPLGIKDSEDLVKMTEILRKGLPQGSFDHIAFVAKIPKKRLSTIVHIPTRTVNNRTKNHERFKPDESDRLLRIARLLFKAFKYTGNLNDAREWLNSPKRSLGNKTPLEFADSSLGAQEVENLLGRLEHGVIS